MSDTTTKPGVRTTEFWLTLLATLASGAAALDILPVEHPSMRLAGLVGMVLSAMGYGAMRAVAKRGQPRG